MNVFASENTTNLPEASGTHRLSTEALPARGSDTKETRGSLMLRTISSVPSSLPSDPIRT